MQERHDSQAPHFWVGLQQRDKHSRLQAAHQTCPLRKSLWQHNEALHLHGSCQAVHVTTHGRLPGFHGAAMCRAGAACLVYVAQIPQAAHDLVGRGRVLQVASLMVSLEQ